MEIKRDNIVLRDFRPRDIEDEVRWNTTRTEWMKAEKLGFREMKREESVYTVDGRAYDAILLELC